MTALLPVACVVLSYVLGATPTSYWIGKFGFGVDLRRRGSGNLGATNTFRVLGAKAALPVMVFDLAKGWLPVWLFPQIDGSTLPVLTLLYAMAAILGHVFSFWVGMRGGKGVATSAGAFIGLAPVAAVIALVAWIAAAASTRIVSLASLVAALTLPVAVALTAPPGGEALIGFSVLLTAFVFWTHRSNLGRLLRGEEHKFGSPTAPHAAAASPPVESTSGNMSESGT